MKKSQFLVLVLVSVIWASCSENKANQTPSSQIPSFPVIEIPQKDVTGYSSYPASIEGTIYSGVRAKVAGYLTEVLVDEGQAVKKGQVLFKIETQSLNEDADAAKANVNAAQVEVNKLSPLVEKGIISNVQLETAKARLAQAQASYNSINANIGYATIKSPINGYVGAIPYRQGALVSPSDESPLTTVSEVDEVYVFFSLNEREYLDMLQSTDGETLQEKITNLPEVDLELVNGKMYSHKGKIQTVTGQINPQTGTVSFRAAFPNPERLLAQGNSGRVQLPKYYKEVVVVPEIATFEQQGKVYVYMVQGDTMAIATQIEVADRINHLIVVGSGIKVKDKIVYEGVGKLRDKSIIQPQKVDFDSVAQSLKVAFK